MDQEQQGLSLQDISGPGDDDFSNFFAYGGHFADLDSHGSSDQHSPPRSLSVSMPTSTAPPTQNQWLQMDTTAFDSVMGDLPVDLAPHAHQSPSNGPPPASYAHAPMAPAFYTQKPSLPQVFHQQLTPDVQPQLHPSSQPSSQPYIPLGQTVVPPTPNSIELQGNAATYPRRIDDNHDVYDQYSRVDEQVSVKPTIYSTPSPMGSPRACMANAPTRPSQVLYTPLVSPAMTPLEAQLRLPEYTVPGEYFTPLTSPALEAQNANSNPYPFNPGPVSEMGFVPSPADNAIPGSSTPSSPAIIRHNHRHRPSTTTNKGFSTRAKKQQSPSVRPRTRKTSLLNVNPDEILNGLSQDKSRPVGTSSLRYGSTESSGQDSVSPESLSEPLMPPPALPPARRSPAIAPQMSQSQNNEPATPAMLMRLQRRQQQQQQQQQQQHQQSPATNIPAPPVSSGLYDDIMEDITLPEAANPTSYLARPEVPRIDTAVRTTVPSPASGVQTTPNLGPKSAPDRPLASVAPSPRSIAMPSPSGPVGKKSDTPKLGPMARKRQSLSSSQPSPNLRPKISPSIKPLVRGDGECLPFFKKKISPPPPRTRANVIVLA